MILTQAKSFLRAVTSGHCDDEEYAARLATCEACPKLRREDGDKIYCGGCGCPSWRMAELHSKLRWKNLSCPLGLWGSVPREMTDQQHAHGVIDDATFRRVFRPADESEVQQWLSTTGLPTEATIGTPLGTGAKAPSPTIATT